MVIHHALKEARHHLYHETDEMESSVDEQEESLSDYGSDFTPDEEEILKGLLQGAPSEADNPIADPDLQLKDLKDDFTHKGARVSKSAYESRLSPTAAREKMSAIQKAGNGGNSTIRMLDSTCIGSTY